MKMKLKFITSAGFSNTLQFIKNTKLLQTQSITCWSLIFQFKKLQKKKTGSTYLSCYRCSIYCAIVSLYRPYSYILLQIIHILFTVKNMKKKKQKLQPTPCALQFIMFVGIQVSLYTTSLFLCLSVSYICNRYYFIHFNISYFSLFL